MSGGERAQVGQALDVIRVALSAYVDTAMVSAYGDRWDDLVAEEDAKRRKDSRRFHVRKNDLAVMLKVLIHRRIEPWSSLREYPRLRAFASEILTVRNLHAHGDDCAGEYSRLLDTAGRMLTLLGIPVPQELHAPRLDLAMIPAIEGSVHLSAQQPQYPPPSRLEAEIAPLGEVGEQVATIFGNAAQLGETLSSAIQDGLAALDPQAPDFNSFHRSLEPRMVSTGQDAIGLLAELERVELASTEPKDPALALLILLARRQLTTGGLGMAMTVYRLDLLAQQAEVMRRITSRISGVTETAVEAHGSGNEQEALELLRGLTPQEDPEFRSLGERFAEADRLVGAMESDNFSHAIQQVASQLGEANGLANVALARESMDAASASKDEDGHWTREALPHLRDAISRLRFEAGMEPGTWRETFLVRALRLEGEVYNDIGQPDDALQAFARAAEIIDRYPSADPDLLD